MANQKTDAIDLSVIICTVDRQELAKKAIASIQDQSNQRQLQFEIIVVDNHPEALARGWVEDMAKTSRYPIVYVHAEKPNISAARNAGLQAAGGRLLGFIDDDEEAVPNWSDDMVQTLDEYDAMLASGPLFPIFACGQPPDWDPEGASYIRCGGTTGRQTGAAMSWASTCNMIFRREALDITGLFDLELGIGGGEDQAFSMRLHDGGHKLVWCETAKVLEFTPEARKQHTYMLLRQFYGSRAFVRVGVKRRSVPAVFVARTMTTGVIQVVAYFLPYLIFRIAPAPGLLPMATQWAKGAGKLTWFFYSAGKFWVRR